MPDEKPETPATQDSPKDAAAPESGAAPGGTNAAEAGDAGRAAPPAPESAPASNPASESASASMTEERRAEAAAEHGRGAAESAETGTGLRESVVAMVSLPPNFEPRKPRLRDWLLTLVPAALLAAIMSFRGDVTNPRGDDPQHALGHFASLIHSGHVPGGVIWGAILTLLTVVGILGLLGDSPLDLRGDEIAVGEIEAPRPWYKREGFWLVMFCVALYVPLAGAYGLWDPWETHYGEVSREILARDDWITLWWGQEGWFMSKPILIFWMSALGMGVGSAFGLPFWRDMAPGAHEWFIRLPIIFFAIAAVYAVYRTVASAWGRRAGLLSGMVLATMPHWFFLSHQAMTDMPFVAPLVIAMCFLILAVIEDPNKVARAWTVKFFGRTLRISYWHLALGAILMIAVPQVLYLLTRPVLFGCPEDADNSCRAALEASRLGPIQFPIERYWSGSAGNSVYRDLASTIPGSPAWEDRYNQAHFFVSFIQGLIWLALGTVLMLSYRKERRVQPLHFALLYLFSAISFMGKGPGGIGVPEVVLTGYLIASRKWHLLARIRLLQGVTIFFLCGMPWYIAIYCRLGDEYFDRFVVHDLLNRAFAGVHGDTGTFRYFVWQLGYAMFPWVGLVPAALAGWRLYVPEGATERQKDVVRLALLWFIVSFSLFSLMITKFHHYIFPAVPSVAVLVGLLLHRMLGARRLPQSTEAVKSMAATAVGVALLVLGVTNFFGAWHGAVSRVAPFKLPPGNPGLGVGMLVLGAALSFWAWWHARRVEVPLEGEVLAVKSEPTEVSGYRDGAKAAAAEPEADAEARGSFLERYRTVGLGAVGVGAAVVLALVARDIGFVGTSRPAGFERFIHLFTYNYERPFPTKSFDYHAILTGFGLIAVVAAAAIAFRATRRQAVRSMIALAACFGFWALDKYMIDLSNHWSQRNLFVKYYAMRNTRDTLGIGEDARYWADPMVAYQMNWKGENFYTGNHAAMLECGLPLCRENTREWLRRHQGQRVFVVTEHSRSGSVISQMRNAGGSGHTVTDEYDNNKFVLIEGQL